LSPAQQVRELSRVVQAGVTNEQFLISIRKNGTEIARGFDLQGATGNIAGVNTSIVADGAVGDYFDVMVYTASNAETLDGGAQNTFFSGTMVASGNGLATASSTVAGTTKDIQFNTSNALDADTGLFVWDKTNHRLGVNIAAPTSALQVSGTFTVSLSTQTTTPSLYVNSSGNVLINTTGHPIGAKLQVTFNGSAEQGITVKNSAASQNGAAIRFIDSGDAYSGGGIFFTSSNAITYATTSDRRLKENIVPTGEGLAKLMEIPVTDFNFKSDPSKTTVQGFIAQDLQKVYPEAVHGGGKDVTNPWGVDYGRMTPLIVRAVQELKAANDNLVSETMRLRLELKAENDNHLNDARAIEELRNELRALKNGVGFKRAVGQ
jgi:hypothetical protein